MGHKARTWKLAGVGALAVAMATLAACGGGVSQEQYDAAQKAAAEQTQKATTAQQQLSAKSQELSQAQQQLAAKEKEFADLKKSASSTAGIIPLVYAKPMPPPTPRPTPTPLPPGVTPPAPARPDATFLNEVLPFAIYAETLGTTSPSSLGFVTYGYKDFSFCNPNAVFKRGSKLVWRFEVIDTKTGKRVTDQDGSTTKIVLPNGQELNARYSKRAGVGPWTWAAGWDIPLDYPLGAFDWSIKVATKDGRTYVWKPPYVNKPESPTSRPEDSRVQIID